MTEPSAIAPGLVRAELERLLDSPLLRRAPSHMRLLRHLVTRRIAGDHAALRETAIAIEVFRRDPSTYDPQTDPIVRVTTGRLRERLATHYATYDREPALRISLPKGRYAPEFVARTGSTPPQLGILIPLTRNQTGDTDLDVRCEAFADRLRDHLAHAGLPGVRGRAERPPGGASASRSALAAELGVAWLLESTLAREQEDELRLSVRLVHAADSTLRWVETAVAQGNNVASLFEKMLDLVLMRTLDTLPLPAAVAAGMASRATAASPHAQRVALEQAQLLLVRRNLPGTDGAVAIAQTAVHAHPEDADAWATLAAALYSRHSFMDHDEGGGLAAIRASADRALALAPEHPVALRTKAILTGKSDHDGAAAEELFRRALRSMPHYTSARINLAELLALQGKAAEAIAELNLARVYDPLSPSALLARATILDMLRSFEESGEAWVLCAAAGEVSLWVLAGIGAHHLLVGRPDLALQAYDDAARRHPDFPMPLMGQACVRALRGDTDGALAAEAGCVERFPHTSPASRAVLAALLGDRDRMLSLLAQAHAGRDLKLAQSAIHPALDRYAQDVAVQRLLPFGCYVGLR